MNIPSSPTAQPPEPKALDDLRRQLYEEGITASAVVETVYPNAGFILKDASGSRIFVHWTNKSPQRNQKVTIKGVVQRISEQNIEALSQDSGFTAEIESFLKGQRIYIQAQDVATS